MLFVNHGSPKQLSCGVSSKYVCYDKLNKHLRVRGHDFRKRIGECRITATLKLIATAGIEHLPAKPAR